METKLGLKEELYVKEPLLKGRLHIAYPMISFMQHPKGELFLYNFFLNLECSKKEEDLNVCYVSQLDHDDISWIHYLNKYHCYLNYFNRDNNEMHMDFQDEIHQGNYIYLSFDDFYLPNKMKKPQHYEHVNMIYGYDSERQIYNTIGYDENRMFGVIDLPFDAAEQGIVKGTVEIFSPDMGKEFEFSIPHFVRQLDDFIEGRNSLVSERALALDGIKKSDYIYGINVYDRIEKSIFELCSDGKGEYDIRTLYMLYEWSRLNFKRISYLREKKVIDFSSEIEKNAFENCKEIEIIHHMMIKYILTKDKKILLKILEKLLHHKEKSVSIYTCMRKELV